jgi:hypothetical protein
VRENVSGRAGERKAGHADHTPIALGTAGKLVGKLYQRTHVVQARFSKGLLVERERLIRYQRGPRRGFMERRVIAAP